MRCVRGAFQERIKLVADERRNKAEGRRCGKGGFSTLKLSRENASAFELGGCRSTALEHDICWQPGGKSRADMHCLQLRHAASLQFASRVTARRSPVPTWRSQSVAPSMRNGDLEMQGQCFHVGFFMIYCRSTRNFTLRPGPAGLLRNHQPG
jgi:hypothetical protein